jgi:hypothetical protein
MLRIRIRMNPLDESETDHPLKSGSQPIGILLSLFVHGVSSFANLLLRHLLYVRDEMSTQTASFFVSRSLSPIPMLRMIRIRLTQST